MSALRPSLLGKTLVVAVSLWAVQITPREAVAKDARFTVTLLQLEAAGTDKATLGEIKKRIVADLDAAGVLVRSLSRKRLPKRSCFESPGCVRRLLGKRKTDAALIVRVLRIGPKVQITIRLLRGDTGMEIRSATVSHPADGFPQSWSPREDIAPMLSAFSEFKPRAVASVAAVEPSPEPTVPPSDETPPPAAPEPETEANAATTVEAEPEPEPEPEPAVVTGIDSPPPPPAERGSMMPMALTIGGGVLVVGGAVAIGMAETVRRDSTSLGSAKETALFYGWAGVGVAAIGLASGVIGAVLWSGD